MAYELAQKIRTYAAIDVKYFYLDEAGGQEHFLVFANTRDQHSISTIPKVDEKRGSAEMNSIIYKFVNGYFTPFQTIRLFDVLQFLPVHVRIGKIDDREKTCKNYKSYYRHPKKNLYY